MLLAHADFTRRDFDQLVVVDEVQRLLQRELGRRGELDRIVLARGAHIGQRLRLDRIDGKVVVLGVNTDQLAWKLQKDARVVAIRRNAKELVPADLPEAAGVVAIDVSFISVRKVLPGAIACAKEGADFVILVKPQFELNRGEVGEGGIVREKALQEKAVAMVRAEAEGLGLTVMASAASHLPGMQGNQEYFLHARKSG